MVLRVQNKYKITNTELTLYRTDRMRIQVFWDLINDNENASTMHFEVWTICRNRYSGVVSHLNE